MVAEKTKRVFKNWVEGIDFPEWMTHEGLTTINKGYLQKGESPKDAYKRVAKAAAFRLKREDLEDKFFGYLWKGWLCPASPVLANMGAVHGLPISCYGIDVEDSINGIGDSLPELMKLTQGGGGVGINVSNIRESGKPIRNSGVSEGSLPFNKIYDSAIFATKQSETLRRGAASVNKNIRDSDIMDFMNMRKPKGDVNRQCLNINHCVIIDDEFMEKIKSGDSESRYKWSELMRTRLETGQPYIMYKGNVNKANPEAYKKNGLEVDMTNICTEIMLHTKPNEYSFVCCLSSLNLAKYDEWADSDLVYDSIYFLDGVLQEFIDKTEMIGDDTSLKHYQKARASAINGRAVGLGVLGWHTYLQKDKTPFISLRSNILTNVIFSRVEKESIRASQDLAKEYGEPLWCEGLGVRNTHRLALAPTTTNAMISGGVSQMTEPLIANAYVQDSSKGKFIRKNPILMDLLIEKGKNTIEVWDRIVSDAGSVQKLDFLSNDEKEVFLTFIEINQLELVRQAALRQKYIDQAQSLNLCFPPDVDTKWFNKVHWEAYKAGLKTLYYCRTATMIKGDKAIDNMKDSCVGCEG